MNKRIIITILSIFVVLLLGLSIFFFYGMSPKDKNDNTVLFTLNSGTSKLAIADALEEQGIIRSALVLKAYLLFHNKMNLQAGVYELKSNMSPKDILNKMASGEVKNDSISITLIEGRRLSEYQSIIANKLNIPLFTFITDISSHNEWIHKNTDFYFVGDISIKESLVDKGIDKNKI